MFHFMSDKQVNARPSSLILSANSSRLCGSDGLWEERTHYDNCQPLPLGAEEHYNITGNECISNPRDIFEKFVIFAIAGVNNYSHSIYTVGYTLSICALTLAIVIFLAFR